MKSINATYDGFCAEYASSGHSSCKRCKGEIPKRSVRFAVHHWADFSDDMVWSFFHFKCLTGGMLRSWNENADGCGVTDLSPSDQQRVHDKITKLLSEEATTKRSAGEISNEAKGKSAKKLRALLDQLTNYRGKEFQLNMEGYHEFMAEIDRKKKEVWKVDRVTSDDLLKESPDLNVLVNTVFWNDLALPEMPGLPVVDDTSSSKPEAKSSPAVLAETAGTVKQGAEDEPHTKDTQEEERFYNQYEAKTAFQLLESDLYKLPFLKVRELDSKRTFEVWSRTSLLNYETRYNKKQAKELSRLSDAKLDVIPFEEVDNPNHRNAKMRAYSRHVLICYQKYHWKLEEYENDLKAQKMFRQRMDELQTVLVERGFPFLNAMMEKNPYLLQIATKGYTDVEWRGRKKDLYKAKDCADLVIDSFPVFQLFRWSNQSFVMNLCGVRYDSRQNIFYPTRTQFKEINKEEVSKKLLTDIDFTKVFMTALQDNAAIVAGFLPPDDVSNFKECFVSLGEPKMAEHFNMTAEKGGGSWWHHSCRFVVLKEHNTSK